MAEHSKIDWCTEDLSPVPAEHYRIMKAGMPTHFTCEGCGTRLHITEGCWCQVEQHEVKRG